MAWRKFAGSVSGLAVVAGFLTVSSAVHASSAELGEDIIVTATLRASSLQDVPLAVTAVTSQALESQGINDIRTLSSVSPSFNIQSTQTETQGTSIRIRGLGTIGNNTGLESSVGVFIDGVYQSRAGVALGDLMDIEQVEILRGPQGTLFGRNTSAGALSVTTKRPSLEEVEGFVNATYGNYDFMNAQAGIGAPVAKNVAVRLSGSWRQRDGYIKGVNGSESHDRNRYIVRGQIYAEPTPDLSIRLLGDYSKIDEKCCASVMVTDTTLNNTFTQHGLPSDGALVVGPEAIKSLTTNAGQFYNDSEQWGVSSEFKLHFGNANLTYIGAYRDFESSASGGSHFTSLAIFSTGHKGEGVHPGLNPSGDRIKTMTHEVRLQGAAFEDKLDWLIGGFYGHEKIVNHAVMTAGKDYQAAASAGNFGMVAGINPLYRLTALGNGGVPVDMAGAYGDNRFDQDGKSLSFFTHNVFNITDQLSLTLGARYVMETKRASYTQAASSNPACQASVTGVLNEAVPTALRNGLISLNCFSYMVPVDLVAPDGELASNYLPLPREWAHRFRDERLTYTAQLAYKVTDEWMVYGGYARGFKSGGFNLDQTSAIVTNSQDVLNDGATPIFHDPRFKSEKVNSYEFGVKGKIGRVNTNLTIFHMDISDFQALDFNGILFTTFNVQDVKSSGFEFEAFGRLADFLSINGGLTYANTRYGENCADGIDPRDVVTVSRLCGSVMSNSPKWSGVLGLTFDTPINEAGWNFMANMNLQYSGSRRTSSTALDTNFEPLPWDWQEDYMKVNARVGVSTPDGNYTIELWGTNLTNELTRSITANTPLRGGVGNRSRGSFIEEPRMYGVTLRAKF